jgi:predicted RNA methylase
MDKSAKDGLRQQLLREPPEVTVGNVLATLEQFLSDAGMIFRRGLATVFSELDRRFRSHDGWKIGSRVILDHAFNEFGTWSYYRNQRDALQDIERVFHVLDEKAMPPSYMGIVGAIESSREGSWGSPRQSEASSDYFTARCFKNGNLHLWFKRDDLLEQVNRLLGEYYGAPIPEDRAPDEDDGLNNPKTSLAKNYGFFPTPDKAAEIVIEAATLYRRGDAGPLTVLEPSAGTGNLAKRCVENGAIVDCVEVHPERAGALKASKQFRHVMLADFLSVEPTDLYDRVVMNPPFDSTRDVDHVVHAIKFLKPDGFLAAIMSAGTEFREDKKTKAFRELMSKKNARWQDLPSRSFASSGTNVNTVIVRFWNDGRNFW